MQPPKVARTWYIYSLMQGLCRLTKCGEVPNCCKRSSRRIEESGPKVSTNSYDFEVKTFGDRTDANQALKQEAIR